MLPPSSGRMTNSQNLHITPLFQIRVDHESALARCNPNKPPRLGEELLKIPHRPTELKIPHLKTEDLNSL